MSNIHALLDYLNRHPRGADIFTLQMETAFSQGEIVELLENELSVEKVQNEYRIRSAKESCISDRPPAEVVDYSGFRIMDMEQLKEVAQTTKPFESDGKSGIRSDPVIAPVGSWSSVNVRPEDIFKTAGIYKAVDGAGMFRYLAAPAASSKKPPRESKPKSKVGPVAVKGFSQNEHAWAMLKALDSDLYGVGMIIHMLCYAPANNGEADLSMSRLAELTKKSQNTIRARVYKLVELGWFKRVDNGIGSPGGAKNNIARYRPSMPEAWER